MQPVATLSACLSQQVEGQSQTCPWMSALCKSSPWAADRLRRKGGASAPAAEVLRPCSAQVKTSNCYLWMSIEGCCDVLFLCRDSGPGPRVKLASSLNIRASSFPVFATVCHCAVVDFMASLIWCSKVNPGYQANCQGHQALGLPLIQTSSQGLKKGSSSKGSVAYSLMGIPWNTRKCVWVNTM